MFHRSQPADEYTAYCTIALCGRFKRRWIQHDFEQIGSGFTVQGKITGRRPTDYEPPTGAVENALHTIRLAMARNKRLGQGFGLEGPALTDWKALIDESLSAHQKYEIKGPEPESTGRFGGTGSDLGPGF